MMLGKSLSEVFFHSSELMRKIRAASKDTPFDIVVGYSSVMLPYVLQADALARVMDIVDVDSDKWEQYAAKARFPMSWLYRREAKKVRRLEQTALKKCSAAVVVTQREKNMLGDSQSAVHVIFNGVDCDYFSPDSVSPADIGPHGLVFTGTMDYKPNVDAVCWFAAEIFPTIKAKIPDATFTIVGRNPKPAVQRLTEVEGVTVTGTVADVRGYLSADGAIAVCPMRLGCGVQNKVLEAMAMQRAVVTSRESVGGLDAVDGTHLVVADTPEDWTREILRLFADAAAREKIARAAREFVAQNYTWAGRLGPLVNLCDELSQQGGER